MSKRRPGNSESPPEVPVEERWNHNIALHDRLLDALPRPCPIALDAGCGDGVLTWALSQQAERVVAVDTDPDCVQRTQRLVADQEGVEVRVADVMDDPALRPESFDAVVSIATLHHLDLTAGLIRLASLVRPGGVLALGGLARSRTGYDLAFDAVGAVRTRIERRRHGGWWEIEAPMTNPRDSYAQVLRTATLMLPGVRYRRHALFRFTVLWNRPEGWSPPEVTVPR